MKKSQFFQKWLPFSILVIGFGLVAFFARSYLSFLPSELLSDDGDRMELTLTDPAQETVSIGDEFSMEVHLTSEKNISKTVVSLDYDPTVVQYMGYDLNEEKYTDYILAKADTEAGWLYYANGRTYPFTSPSDEWFVRVHFMAIAPGPTQIKLDNEISKITEGEEYSIIPLDLVGPTPDPIISIQEPTTLVDLVGASDYPLTASGAFLTTNNEVTFLANFEDLGGNFITSYRMKELNDPTPWRFVDRYSYIESNEITHTLSGGNGEKVVALWFEDFFGNALPSSGPVIYTFYKDTTPPIIDTITTLAQTTNEQIGPRTNKNVLTFEWSFVENYGADIADQLFTLYKNEQQQFTQNIDHTEQYYELSNPLQDGTFTPVITVTDALGQQRTATGSTFTVDTVVPTFTGPGLTRVSEVSDINPLFEYQTIEDAGEYTIQVLSDADTITEFTFYPTLNNLISLGKGLLDGTYSARIKAKDIAGNMSEYSDPLSFTIRTELSELRETKLTLEEEIEARNTELSSLKTQQEDIENELNATKQELAQKENELLAIQKQIEKLEQDQAALQASVASLRVTLAAKNESIKKLEQELAKEKTLSGSGSQLYKELDAEYKKLIEEKSVLEQDLKTTQNDLAATSGQLVQEKKRAETNYTSTFVIAQSERRLQQQVRQLNSDLENYQKTLETLQQELDTQRARADAAEKRPDDVKFIAVPQYFDLRQNHWAHEVITRLASAGILKGYPDGSFRPNQAITRAEFLKVVLSADQIIPVPTTKALFRDVPAGAWYADYISTAVQKGIVQGYSDETFRPHLSITRAEAIKILLEAQNIPVQPVSSTSFRDVAPNIWYAPYVETASQIRIIQGYSDETFRPAAPLTRAEAAKLVSFFLTQ